MKIIEDKITAPTRVTKTEGKPDVVVLLDASGSMSPHRETVVSTFNEYVQSVKGSAHSISLYTFDSEGIREKIYKENPSRVPKLTEEDYVPNAMTPLFDAMGAVMKKFEDSTRNVQFVTHTDGAENSSSEWTFESLDAFIKNQTQKGWLFVHLGEGISGQAQMSNFAGVKYNFNAATRKGAMRKLGEDTALYSATMSNAVSAYTGNDGDTVEITDNGDEDQAQATA